jgi:glycosyltransferase involved in cell wall biosynthesis
MTVQSMITVKDLPPPPIGKRGWPWTVGAKPLASRSGAQFWPKLSIVTPSYNQGQFLEATIRSVLLQGYPNLEYIIIDGASSDESVAIIRKYERWLSFWVSEPDDGQTAAINKGLERSTGEYLGWVNSDDLYAKRAFQHAVQLLMRHPRCSFVHGNHILIDSNGAVFGCTALPQFDPPKVSVPVFSETAFWTNKAMVAVGMLDPKFNFSMDLEFFTRLALYGSPVKSGKFLGYFRCHSDSKTSTIPMQGRTETDNLWAKLFDQEYPSHEISLVYLRLSMLISMIANPGLIAFPYLKTRLDKFSLMK